METKEAKLITKVPRSIKWEECRECTIIVYAALRSFMDWETRVCYPSQASIAKKAKISVPETQKCLDELEEKDIIERRHEYGKRSCIYHFNPLVNEKCFDRFTEQFFALEIPTKTKIFYMKLQQYLLINDRSEEVLLKMNTTELSKTLHMAFNTVKKHMNILKECGIFAPSTTALATIVNVKKLGQEILFMQQRQDALEKAQSDQDQEVKALKRKVYHLEAVIERLEQEKQREKYKNIDIIL